MDSGAQVLPPLFCSLAEKLFIMTALLILRLDWITLAFALPPLIVPLKASEDRRISEQFPGFETVFWFLHLFQSLEPNKRLLDSFLILEEPISL